MRVTPLLPVMALLWTSLAQAGPITIDISLAGQDQARALWVDMAFDGDGDGHTVVRLPDRFGYADELSRNVSDISIEGARLKTGPVGQLVLNHAPFAAIRLRYRVQTGPRIPSGLGVEQRPALTNDGLAFLGETVIAYPEGRLDAPVMIRLGSPPVGWSLASDIEGSGTSTLRDARESYLVSGPTVRIVVRRLPDGSTLRVALRGQFGFADADVADRAAVIVAYQRRFWEAPAAPFLITIDEIPGRPGVTYWGGLGRGEDGAALYASRDVTLAKFSEVLAHEPAHAWFARALGGLPAGAAEPEGYWFSEGFADYLAYRTLAETSVMSSDQLQWMFLITSPPEPVTLARMRTDYWRNPDLFDAPYFQGFYLALLWDERLRATGKGLGLRDILLAQAQLAAKAPGPTADKLFPATYKSLSSLDLSADIARYLVRGERVELSSKVRLACGLENEAPIPGNDEPVPLAKPEHCVSALFGKGI